jgi:pyruvate-formate lyase-activating enzyme
MTQCKAKGNELHLWLHFGQLASCCKSFPVDLTQEDLKDFLNHPVISNQKNNLDSGIQDPSCEYCWKMENKGLSSLRTAKNLSPSRKVLEISFDNTCNLYCLYCGPHNSSKWKSISSHSDSPMIRSKIKENNNLNKLFDYDNLPNILTKNQVDALSFIGGEPFMSKNFYNFLQKYDFDQNTKYEVVTNLCPDIDNILDLFLEKTKSTEVCFLLSLDSDPDTAEIIRTGFNKDIFMRNLEKILLAEQVVEIKILNTITCLSAFKIPELMAFIDSIAKTTSKKIKVESSLLVNPGYLSNRSLDSKSIEYLSAHLKDFDMKEQILIDIKNNKTFQTQLLNFLIQMEKVSGIGLDRYDSLTQGLISRIQRS